MRVWLRLVSALWTMESVLKKSHSTRAPSSLELSKSPNRARLETSRISYGERNANRSSHIALRGQASLSLLSSLSEARKAHAKRAVLLDRASNETEKRRIEERKRPFGRVGGSDLQFRWCLSLVETGVEAL